LLLERDFQPLTRRSTPPERVFYERAPPALFSKCCSFQSTYGMALAQSGRKAGLFPFLGNEGAFHYQPGAFFLTFGHITRDSRQPLRLYRTFFVLFRPLAAIVPQSPRVWHLARSCRPCPPWDKPAVRRGFAPPLPARAGAPFIVPGSFKYPSGWIWDALGAWGPFLARAVVCFF